MRELLRMIIVLTVISASSALVLSYANQATKEQREYQLLKYVKEPSIKAVLEGFQYTNDPIKDRFSVDLGVGEKGKPLVKTVFPAKKDGKVVGMAYDTSTTGYNGPIGVMIGIDVAGGAVSGVSVMTHSETPGLGARVVEPGFSNQFKGLDLSPALHLTSKGGKIDSISGASISSNGVVNAVRDALQLFPKVKKEVG